MTSLSAAAIPIDVVAKSIDLAQKSPVLPKGDRAFLISTVQL
jgi:hypothetical protein